MHGRGWRLNTLARKPRIFDHVVLLLSWLLGASVQQQPHTLHEPWCFAESLFLFEYGRGAGDAGTGAHADEKQNPTC